ncbi:MAG TPA: IS1634 family transposase [Verrucomicrobiae bacterium]|nr:IS1634 family transposase [Verrucomicrobiae bacterium]
MFLRYNTRKKDGKQHRYWSVVENRRLRHGQTTQRTVLYLGEINDTQQAAWRKSLEVFDEASQLTQQICLFPEDRDIPPDVLNGLQVKLCELTLEHPRAFGDCWLGCRLWDELQLGCFWRERLPEGKAQVPWFKVLELLTVRQLVAPGSKWHLHRRWFLSSAMDQLLDEDFALAAKNRLYECLDRLDEPRAALFTHLQGRWKDLFGATYDLLLYDLTSTYFEGQMEQAPKAQYGHSRDQRPDCRQLVIAVVLSAEGFPLAYETMPGNTSDKTTLKAFLEKIQTQYGKARRIWIMDRGIPTEETLEQMRQSDPPVGYLVGTPRSRWEQYKEDFEKLPWQKLRDAVEVKLLAQGPEVYVLVKSQGRREKERAIRRKKLARLLRTLRVLRRQRARPWKRDTLLHKLGAAHQAAGGAWRFVKITLPKARQPVNRDTFKFELLKDKLKEAQERDGHYLLRGFNAGDQAGPMWERYMQLTEIEGAFKTLKSDLQLRPIRHHVEARIEAHILVCFLAYCLSVTLRQRLRAHAPGLTPRAVLETLSGILMLDVHVPLADGRELVMARYTQPEAEHRLVLEKLGWALPPQPPPRIRRAQVCVSASPETKSKL